MLFTILRGLCRQFINGNHDARFINYLKALSMRDLGRSGRFGFGTHAYLALWGVSLGVFENREV